MRNREQFTIIDDIWWKIKSFDRVTSFEWWSYSYLVIDGVKLYWKWKDFGIENLKFNFDDDEYGNEDSYYDTDHKHWVEAIIGVVVFLLLICLWKW